MTREQAKVYAKLSKEDLESIRPSLGQHYEFLKAYANGEDVEEKFEFGWGKAMDPEFYEYSQYRIKKAPEVKKHSLNWIPQVGQAYYFINISAVQDNVQVSVRSDAIWSEEAFQERAKNFNIFKDMASATTAYLTIKELLKSLHSCKTDLYF